MSVTWPPLSCIRHLENVLAWPLWRDLDLKTRGLLTVLALELELALALAPEVRECHDVM